MSDFYAKIPQIGFRLGSAPDPSEGAYSAPPAGGRGWLPSSPRTTLPALGPSGLDSRVHAWKFFININPWSLQSTQTPHTPTPYSYSVQLNHSLTLTKAWVLLLIQNLCNCVSLRHDIKLPANEVVFWSKRKYSMTSILEQKPVTSVTQSWHNSRTTNRETRTELQKSHLS